MEENRVRDIYELERIALPAFEKLAKNEDPGELIDRITDEEGCVLLNRICDLMRKDLEEDDLK